MRLGAIVRFSFDPIFPEIFSQASGVDCNRVRSPERPLMSYAIPLFPFAFTRVTNLRAFTNGAHIRSVNVLARSALRKIRANAYDTIKGFTKIQPT